MKKIVLLCVCLGVAIHVYYAKNSTYTLINEDESISTSIKSPTMLAFVDIPKNSPITQESRFAIYSIAKANAMFKNYGVNVSVIVNIDKDANENIILSYLNMFQKNHKIQVNIFIDKNKKFSKKLNIKNMPCVALIKDGQIKYYTNDMKLRWFDADGMNLVSKHLGISIGL